MACSQDLFHESLLVEALPSLLQPDASFDGDYESIGSGTQMRGCESAPIHVFLPCGTLPFCENTSNDDCYAEPIQSCEQCSMVKAGLFLFFLLLLALGILVGNILIISVGLLRYKEGTINKADAAKTSLAIADLLTGILLLIFIPYNFSWIIPISIEDLVDEVINLRQSAIANFGAVFYLFGYTSSVYHLIFMGFQRLYAIWKPLNYRFQAKSVVYISLALVWILSVVAATTPTWFPDKLTASLSVPLMLYVPIVRRSIYTTPLIVTAVVFLIVPYVIMSSLTVVVGVLSATKLRKSMRLRGKAGSADNNQRKKQKHERRLYVTLVVMQIGFTISIVPLAAVSLLFYLEKLNCRNFSVPFVTTFYLSMANNFFNVVIYNIRDRNFRVSVKKLFSPIGAFFPSVANSNSHSSTVRTVTK